LILEENHYNRCNDTGYNPYPKEKFSKPFHFEEAAHGFFVGLNAIVELGFYPFVVVRNCGVGFFNLGKSRIYDRYMLF